MKGSGFVGHGEEVGSRVQGQATVCTSVNPWALCYHPPAKQGVNDQQYELSKLPVRPLTRGYRPRSGRPMRWHRTPHRRAQHRPGRGDSVTLDRLVASGGPQSGHAAWLPSCPGFLSRDPRHELAVDERHCEHLTWERAPPGLWPCVPLHAGPHWEGAAGARGPEALSPQLLALSPLPPQGTSTSCVPAECHTSSGAKCTERRR